MTTLHTASLVVDPEIAKQATGLLVKHFEGRPGVNLTPHGNINSAPLLPALLMTYDQASQKSSPSCRTPRRKSTAS
jgi:hypothetical protein